MFFNSPASGLSLRSKDDLIAELDGTTLTLNRRINELASKETQELLRSYLSRASVNDPYQFENLVSEINRIRTALKQVRRTQAKHAGASGATSLISLGAAYGTEDQATEIAVTVAALTAVFSAYKIKTIHNINIEIKKLDQLDKIIKENEFSNAQLAHLLKPEDRDWIQGIRKVYFDTHIVATNREEVEEARLNRLPRVGHQIRFNPAVSMLPEVTFTREPEHNHNVNMTNR